MTRFSQQKNPATCTKPPPPSSAIGLPEPHTRSVPNHRPVRLGEFSRPRFHRTPRVALSRDSAGGYDEGMRFTHWMWAGLYGGLALTTVGFLYGMSLEGPQGPMHDFHQRAASVTLMAGLALALVSSFLLAIWRLLAPKTLHLP